jgi:putative sterol carrier protein
MENQIDALINRLPAAFLPEKAENTLAIIQLVLSGEGGGDWIIKIEQGSCNVEKGTAANPSLLFSATAQDCLDVFSGKLDGMRAYMSGRLRLQGDMSLAMRLSKLFSAEKFM